MTDRFHFDQHLTSRDPPFASTNRRRMAVTSVNMPGAWPHSITKEVLTEDGLFLPRPKTRGRRLLPHQSGLSTSSASTELSDGSTPKLVEDSQGRYKQLQLVPDELFLHQITTQSGQQPRFSSRASFQELAPRTPDELFLPELESQSTSGPLLNSGDTYALFRNLTQQDSIPRLTLQVNAMSKRTMKLPLPQRDFLPVQRAAGNIKIARTKRNNNPYANAMVGSARSPEQNELFLENTHTGSLETRRVERRAQFNVPGDNLTAALNDLASSHAGPVESLDITFLNYAPPPELQTLQNGTSVELESMLEPSIDRVRARVVEQMRQTAATAAEKRGQIPRRKPLSRDSVSR